MNHVESTLPRPFSVAVEWLECFEWLGLAMGLFASKNRSFRQIHKQRWERELCKLLVHSPSESMLMPLHRKLPSHVTQLIQTLQLRSNFRTQSKKENPAGRTGGRRTRRTKRTTRARKEIDVYLKLILKFFKIKDECSDRTCNSNLQKHTAE